MRVLKNKKIVSAAIAIFIFLISCSIFSLVDTTSIISDETTEIDDTKNMLRSSALSPVFDGMYVRYNFSEGPTHFISNFSYSHVSGSLFNQTWNQEGYAEATWSLDIQTRIMSGCLGFVDGSHDPVWIFTNASLGDTIPISVADTGDHSFNVSNDLVYDLPSYGPIDVWELVDKALPGGIAWYEKSTGLLINGTFVYSGGASKYSFSFIETNVDFTYYEPPPDDTLTVTNPDSISVWEMGTSQVINWTSTGSIVNVKIELYKGGVLLMEIVASTPNSGSFNWTIPTDLDDGIDYQVRISDVSNPAIYDDSPSFAITSVDVPGDDAIPGYNLYILIGIISIVSVILLKNRKKL